MTVPRPVIVDEPAAASGHELTLSAGTNRARTASAVVQPGDSIPPVEHSPRLSTVGVVSVPRSHGVPPARLECHTSAWSATCAMEWLVRPRRASDTPSRR